MALEDKKLPPDLKPDPALFEAIERLKTPDGTISCEAAIGLAEAKNIETGEVGRTLDAMSLRIGRCQLGTFGYPGHAKGWTISGLDRAPEPEGLRATLQEAAGQARRISCPVLWKIAEQYGVSRMQAGSVADRAGLKIIGCQLGAF